MDERPEERTETVEGADGASGPEPSLAAKISADATGATDAAPRRTGPDDRPASDRVDDAAAVAGREPSDVMPGEGAPGGSDLAADASPGTPSGRELA